MQKSLKVQWFDHTASGQYELLDAFDTIPKLSVIYPNVQLEADNKLSKTWRANILDRV